MEDRLPLPKEIGPHEGIEFDLMQKGLKNIAMFTDYLPSEADEIVKRNNFHVIKLRRYFEGREFFTTIIYRGGFSESAEELSDIIKSEPSSFDPVVERRIGELLSYSDVEIDVYIEFHLSKMRQVPSI
jgi:hypothetical protein